ncbi:MAG: tRNA (adenosine(37)-N6)-threonylcarbamoyltransferase complex dimerization subunit type 1 TsaB [Balneolaceae bacterium]
MLLAIETSTEICSVAFRSVEGVVMEKRRIGRGVHSEELFLFIDELMHEEGLKTEALEAILLSRGPGQYTGLRIGAAAVKGLLFGKERPFWTMGTLEGFAVGAFSVIEDSGKIHAVLDARREHLYHQTLTVENGQLAFGKASIRRITEVEQELNEGDHLIGTGMERLSVYGQDAYTFHSSEKVTAVNLLRAWEDSRFRIRFRAEDPVQFEPDYLSGQAW